MIVIWDQPILARVEDIVKQLRFEIRETGVDLLRDINPTNRNIMCTCPFHAEGKERHPSLGISTVETKEGKKTYPAGMVHCFTCGFTSDLPEFISSILGKKDRGMEGYKWITTRFSSVTVDNRQPLDLDMTRGTERKKKEVVSEEELASYRFYHPYMHYRKLTDKVIDYFDVGYDKKTDSLTFPVHDLDGDVLFVQRRAVARKTFLNQSVAEKGKVVYGLYHVYKNLSWIKELYICESIIDALTLWTYRIPAVAIMGALPTNHQIQLLSKVPVRKFVIALDNPLLDKAGREGSERLGNNLSRYKLVNYLKFPDEVKDVNDMTEEQVNTREVVNYQYWKLKT